MDAPEPHILTHWYGMRRARWWRAARWPALAALGLPLLLCVQAALYGVYIYYVRGWQAGVAGNQGVAQAFIAFNRELGPLLAIAGELTIAVALVLAGWQLREGLVPDELAVSQSPQELREYQRAYARRSIWLWVALICMPQYIVSFVGTLALQLTGRQGSGPWNFSAADWLLFAALLALLAEVAARLALLPRITSIWFVLLPFGLYIVVRGGVMLAWSTINDLENMDVLTEPQADGARLLLGVVLAAAFGLAAWRLHVSSARAGTTMLRP